MGGKDHIAAVRRRTAAVGCPRHCPRVRIAGGLTGDIAMSMVFALVLLGFADEGTVCERLATPPQVYATKALCEAGQEAALQSDVALRADYPTIVSRCLATGGQMVAVGGRARHAR
jgi:hypothetical protein